MQKILNLLFILVIVAIASITPLNTALLKINIFAPVVETEKEKPKIIEHISFIGIEGAKLAGRAEENPEHADYWTDVNPATHLLGFIQSEQSFSIRFLYESNTGEFNTSFPSLTLRINDEQDINVLPVEKNLDISNKASGHQAVFTMDKAALSSSLGKGYNTVAVLKGDAVLGHYILAVDTKIENKLLRYQTEIPQNNKVIRYHFADADDRVLVPVCRFHPAYFYDYIVVFETLHKGAAKGLGLKENPAVAHTNSYWISNNSARIDYRSKAIEHITDKELMYRSVGYTFAELGKLTRTHVYVDGVSASQFDTPRPPFTYDCIEGNTGFLLITETSSRADNISSHISAFIGRMHEKQILPPHCRLVNCEKGEQGELRISVSNYEDIENPQIFEPLLNLTAFGFEGVERVFLNDRELLEIKAFNLEE